LGLALIVKTKLSNQQGIAFNPVNDPMLVVDAA
jgi:hypothetical protein